MPANQPQRQMVQFGAFEADLESGELRKSGVRLKLADQPFRVLAYLLSRPGQVVTREDLQKSLWPTDTFVDFDHGLNSAINKLREVLSDSASTPRFIETVPRRGYRFIAPVDGLPLVEVKPALQEVAEGVAFGQEKHNDARAISRVERRARYAWIALSSCALIGLVLGVASLKRKPADGPVVRFSFSPPAKTPPFTRLAISPEGRQIAFTNGFALWLRPIDSLTSRELSGSDRANYPSWSPDGRFVLFHSGDGKLKSIDVGGDHTSVQTLLSTPRVLGAGAWSTAGVVLFQAEQSGAGLNLVSASGGTPAPVTRLNPTHQEISHRYPLFLPDGRRFLYWVWSAAEEYCGIYVGSLDPNEKMPGVPLVRTWRRALYAEPGYLLFLRGSTLMAQRFDAARLRLTGEPEGLPERVMTTPGVSGEAMFSVSSNGILAYQEAVPPAGRRLVWRDRAGKQVRAIDTPAETEILSLAPDEKRLAVSANNAQVGADVWVLDLNRGTSSRLTSSTTAANEFPIWSPDGGQLVFVSNRAGVVDLYAKRADGAGKEELIVRSGRFKLPNDWSRDGKFLAYVEEDPKTKQDLWILPLQGERKPFLFLRTEFREFWARFSPVPDTQGRLWMAYASDETGRFEIYLRPFLPGAPGGPAGAKVRISSGGGSFPRWRKDGRELFYRSLDGKLMAADVKLGASAEVGTPYMLFDLPATLQGYAPLGDGSRFLVIEPAGELAAAKINVVLNWTAELKR